MDGNGRWARARKLPRHFGHKAGVESVRRVVEACIDRGVDVLTLFAFSSENWRRPKTEVGLLMELFLTTLKREIRKLHKNGVRLRIIGDREQFGDKLREHIAAANNSPPRIPVLPWWSRPITADAGTSRARCGNCVRRCAPVNWCPRS